MTKSKEERRIYNKAYREKNKDKLRAYDRERNKLPARKKQIKDSLSKYKEENKEAIRGYYKEYYINNKDVIKVNREKYEKSDKGKAARRNKDARRRLQFKASALVKLYTTETTFIYKGTPEGMVVDHIVPLVHPHVCGLHVPWNLQYLTISDNAKKSNKYPI